MKFIQGDIPGLLVIEPVVFADDRGYFLEYYHQERMLEAGIEGTFVQDNESMSARGVIRALHFQNPPYAQGKLVRVVRGSVCDVAVDIRKGSPWYGKHQKVLLSAENMRMFWLPPGFAHGFVSLEDHTIVNYKCTQPFRRESEGSIRWDDPVLAIDWGVTDPMVSERDRLATGFTDHEGLFFYSRP